jgi:ABC-type glycerol-3-phosphate transport system permease component
MATVAVPRREAVVTTRGEGEEPGPQITRIVAYIALVLVAIIMFVPFLWSITTSLKTNPEAALFPPTLLPRTPTFDAYQRVLTGAPFFRWFANSALVAGLVVVFRGAFCTMAGYAFARMKFPGRDALFMLVLATMMVPATVLFVPRYIVVLNLGLVNSLNAMWIPFMVDAFGVFLMRQFFQSIPYELEEAARIDGASRFRMFWQVIVPLALPAIATLCIVAFQGSWNNFIDALIFISGSNRDIFTLPLGLAQFQNFYYTDWPVVMAMAVLTTIPIAVVYLFFQRYWVEGVTHTAVKG